MKTNEQATASLPAASKDWVEAYLMEYQTDPTKEKRLWSFQYNPQQLRFSGDAKYSESNTFASREGDLQFGSSSGLTLEIGNIYLDTYCLDKSLRPLLEGLDELRKADLKNKKFAPPVLSFLWGKRRFAPCVLTQINWDESAWLGGEPARVQLSMTLQEVPKPLIPKAGKASARPDLQPAKDKKLQEDGKPRNDLTDRQREEGSKKAKEWLNANLNTLDLSIQNLVRSNSYKLATDTKTGNVTMTNPKGKTVGIVGRWDGKTFATANINTLPKKK